MLTGYIAAVAFVILLAIGIFCFGYAAKRSSPLHVLLLETSCGAILILPILLGVEHLSLTSLFTQPGIKDWLWLSASSLFSFSGGNYFSLLNLKTAGERVNSLLSPCVTAVSVVLSYFVFREKLHLIQWTGIIITLSAVVWFLFRMVQNSVDLKQSKTGVISGIAAVLCISLSVICAIKGATDHISIFHSIWIRLLVALVVVTLASLTSGKSFTTTQSRWFYLAILAGVVVHTIIANYLWYYASFHIGVSLFQTIVATLPLWVYAIDRYLLKGSKPSLLFVITALVAAVGVCLVML